MPYFIASFGKADKGLSQEAQHTDNYSTITFTCSLGKNFLTFGGLLDRTPLLERFKY